MEYNDTNIQNVSDFLLWVKEASKTEVMSDEGKPLEVHIYNKRMAFSVILLFISLILR